jgi:hypothetical protein
MRERFAALGSRNVVVTGNLKLDVPAPPADSDKLDWLMAMTRGRPVVVAASTHPGEEEILTETHRTLAEYFPRLLTVIVPRHPDRGEAIARMIAASGLNATLRSHEDLPTATTDIYVADTMGELGLFYRLAPIVFMGGSLVEHGGQNPIEAIKLGASIVHGPHVFNFADVYEALDSAGGARRADTQEMLVKPDRTIACRSQGARSLAHRVRARGRATRRRAGAHAHSSSSLICCNCGSRWEPPMREPGFWHGPASLNSHLLRPLGALYGAIAATALQRRGLHAGIPVLCVGNYHVGGAGKTPTVQALSKLLRDLGETPVVLSRGYGGKLRGPVRVDPGAACGVRRRDEPLMLAGQLPVVVRAAAPRASRWCVRKARP